ncbi:MAG TPA: hypothetical protein VIM44_03855 [Rariglobus sp.]
MSFLSSHRLHWGVHHELSDNFWVHLEEMVRSTSTSVTSPTALPATHADAATPDAGLTSLSDAPNIQPGT